MPSERIITKDARTDKQAFNTRFQSLGRSNHFVGIVLLFIFPVLVHQQNQHGHTDGHIPTGPAYTTAYYAYYLAEYGK
jgi:hypothetical protein